MDIEFHYHINFLVALAAGFNVTQARTIAYSSQYTDDNTREYNIYNENYQLYAKKNPNNYLEYAFNYFKSPLLPSKNGDNTIPQAKKEICFPYRNHLSQSYNLTIKEEILTKIYSCFHFIPGESNYSSKKRGDKQKNSLATSPNSALARDVLFAAGNSGNLYWLGIASHAYSDTWAHQHFTGTFDNYNSLQLQCCNSYPFGVQDDDESFHHALDTPEFSNNFFHKPAGHLDALEEPDRIGKIWHDCRLKKSEICNNERFKAAACNLFKAYCDILHRNPLLAKSCTACIANNRQHLSLPIAKREQILMATLRKIFNNTKNMDKKSRLECYNNCAEALCNKKIPNYNKNSWFSHAVMRTRQASKYIYIWKKGDFLRKKWYLFQENVKKHQNYLWPKIKEIQRANP